MGIEMLPRMSPEEIEKRALINKAEHIVVFTRKNAWSFGQKVLIKFWLGSQLETGMKYLLNNAAEDKWVAAQSPEVDWDAIDDSYMKKLLYNSNTEIPRVA
jgi:hypothetical protein